MPFAEITDNDWNELFQVNVMSGIRASRHYLPQMKKKGWGRVVFISSESALAVPREMIDYAMTKTAQLAIARGLAEDADGTGRHCEFGPARPDEFRNHGWLDEVQCAGAGHHA